MATGDLMDIEHEVMVHRYRYYIMCSPLISDSEYDRLEKKARDQLPSSSPVHNIGSGLEESYNPLVIKDARGRK